MAAAPRYLVLAFTRDPAGHVVLAERVSAVSERTAVAAARALVPARCGAAVVERTGSTSRVVFRVGVVSNAALPVDDP